MQNLPHADVRDVQGLLEHVKFASNRSTDEVVVVPVRVRSGNGTTGRIPVRKWPLPTVSLFFPRVRTPCGHGAQVIVEGREEQTDGGERNEDPKTNPNQTPKPAGRNSTIL